MRASSLKCRFSIQRADDKSKLWLEMNVMKFIGNEDKIFYLGTKYSLINIDGKQYNNSSFEGRIKVSVSVT